MAMRISAALALLYGLLIVVVLSIPLYYGQPLDFGTHVGDIVPAISCTSLLAGSFLALFRHRSPVLVAAWSWSLALQTSYLTRLLTHVSDFRAALAIAGDAGGHASMRQVLEQAAQASLLTQLAFCAVPLVGLALVLLGNGRTARRADAA
jgi:hypothetical protein